MIDMPLCVDPNLTTYTSSTETSPSTGVVSTALAISDAVSLLLVAAVIARAIYRWTDSTWPRE